LFAAQGVEIKACRDSAQIMAGKQPPGKDLINRSAPSEDRSHTSGTARYKRPLSSAALGSVVSDILLRFPQIIGTSTQVGVK
jgi:hypothetical protein